MAVFARLHPAPSEGLLLPYERSVSTLDGPSAALVRAAYAALPDVERGLAEGQAPDVATLVDNLVPPFVEPTLRFSRVEDGDVVGYVGLGTKDAPVSALLLVVQPTVPPATGIQDEEHHRVVDKAGRPVWLHASVWFAPRGTPPAPGVANPVALGYLRVRPS